MTRLGEGDRRIRFLIPVPGPFGHAVDELALRAWWVRDVPEQAVPDYVTTVGGHTSFRFGARTFAYDRHGLRPDPTRPREDEDEEDDGP